MRRTIFLYLFPAGLIVAGWLRLEERPVGWRAMWIALLALLPALTRKRRLQIPLAAGAFLLAANSALSVSLFDARPFDPHHDFFGPLLARFGGGVGEFYDVVLPFSRSAHPRMHGVVLLAVFAFCLLLALTISARRPRAASLALLVGAGWPATLLSDSRDLERGALLLIGVLFLLVTLRERRETRRKQVVFAAAGVALAALAASNSSAVAKGGFLGWQHWDFYNRPGSPVSVRYVWNSDYRGIRFPRKLTTVLRVKAPPQSLYWRAATLDAFVGDRWIEDSVLVEPTATGGPDVRSDLLLPTRAAKAANLVEQEVTNVALADRRLPGASVPVAYQLDSPEELALTRDGGAMLTHTLERNRHYQVWSYAPPATPAKLARSRPLYPPAIKRGRRYLAVQGSKSVPPFGVPQRDARMAEFFRAHDDDPDVRPYRALYAKARSIVGRPRSPYAAAVALESWFRSSGVFRYDERPPTAPHLPPLVGFVLRTHTGYCQHFAGAMTLMLRYLGIPARVAAGFTSGRYDEGEATWRVTDHDAHTWVEVWFRGFGWLPFDPTPGRGTLGAPYTAASPSFDVTGAARVVAGSFLAATKIADRLHRLALLRGSRSGERKGAPTQVPNDRQPGAGLILLLLTAGAGAAALLGTAKLVRRRLRYFTRNPRRTATACRLELAEFLRDQRVDVPASTTTAQLGALVEAEFAIAVRPFVRETTAARFAPLEEARGAAGRARIELKRLRRRLRSELGALERTRGLLSLRSFTA
jgi:transglutaminase-like putative cysteine protease